MMYEREVLEQAIPCPARRRNGCCLAGPTQCWRDQDVLPIPRSSRLANRPDVRRPTAHAPTVTREPSAHSRCIRIHMCERRVDP